MNSPKFRYRDHNFICISHIEVIGSLTLVSRLLFAVVVLFLLTNIKKLIRNIKKLWSMWSDRFDTAIRSDPLLYYSRTNTSLCIVGTK